MKPPSGSTEEFLAALLALPNITAWRIGKTRQVLHGGRLHWKSDIYQILHWPAARFERVRIAEVRQEAASLVVVDGDGKCWLALRMTAWGLADSRRILPGEKGLIG
jgi:hypothetical protein